MVASFLNTPIMADFPSKVTTETSAPSAQGSQQGGNSFSGMAADFTTMVDISFIRSIPAILMIAEVVCPRLQAVLFILLLTVFILKLFSVPFCSEAKLLPCIFLFCPILCQRMISETISGFIYSLSHFLYLMFFYDKT